MRLQKTIVLLLTVLVMLTGCKENKKGKTNMLPNPAGAICDVLVIISEESWKGELGNAYREALKEPYPYLPQTEPYFNVAHVTKDVFASTAEKFRNLIINKIDPRFKKPEFVIQKDVYASSQIVINVVAPTTEAAAIYIKENADRLREILDQTEKDRFAEIAEEKAEETLFTAVKNKFDFGISIPSGYQLRTNKDSFMWISLETTLTSQGLLIYTSKYNGESSFTEAALSNTADGLTKQFVPGPSDGSYMVTGKTVPPKVEKLTYKGRTWYRMRGFWDVKNDFMGGPFVSYSTYWKEKNVVLNIRAYVYVPKKEKRKLLLQTEALIFTVDLDGKKS